MLPFRSATQRGMKALFYFYRINGIRVRSVSRREDFKFMHQEYIGICNTGNADVTDLISKCKTAQLVTRVLQFSSYITRNKLFKKIQSLYAIKSPDERDYRIAYGVCLAAL
jgi:hypothetical protein